MPQPRRFLVRTATSAVTRPRLTGAGPAALELRQRERGDPGARPAGARLPGRRRWRFSAGSGPCATTSPVLASRTGDLPVTGLVGSGNPHKLSEAWSKPSEPATSCRRSRSSRRGAKCAFDSSAGTQITGASDLRVTRIAMLSASLNFLPMTPPGRRSTIPIAVDAQSCPRTLARALTRMFGSSHRSVIRPDESKRNIVVTIGTSAPWPRSPISSTPSWTEIPSSSISAGSDTTAPQSPFGDLIRMWASELQAKTAPFPKSNNPPSRRPGYGGRGRPVDHRRSSGAGPPEGRPDEKSGTEYLPIPTRAGGVIEPHGRHLSALV